MQKSNEYLNNLNENQKLAVTSDKRHIRVVAGAGSGKTRVLTTRILHLINEFKVDSKEIIAITFTNKAANEMKERVLKEIRDIKKMPHISTIHSFCVSVLRQDIPHFGYPRNFTVIDSDDQKTIIKEAFKKYDISAKEISPSSVINYISGHKVAEINPAAAKSMAGSSYNEDYYRALTYEYYLERQKQLYALDFDDLLIWVKNLFLTNPSVLAKWQYKFNSILVDEFQDVDHIQFQIIKSLVGENNALYVVGDPDQTIYTWRGADVDIIMSLEKKYPDLQTIVLDQNYRSSEMILQAANSLINNNKYRVKKELTAVNRGGDEIVYFGGASDEDESSWVASTINNLRIVKKIDYRDIGILYRANYLSRSLEKGLMNLGIPYTIYGGIRFYDRKEIKDILCYLRILLTNDDLAFKRIVNVPSRKIGQKTVDSIQEEALKKNCSMLETLSEPSFLKGKNLTTLSDFYKMINIFKSKVEEYNLVELVSYIFDKSGYKSMLEETNEYERLENVKELIEDINEFTSSFPEAGLDEYLQIVSLYTDKADKNTSSVVSLMTVHAAKGLEFDNVFVTGLNESVFPSARSLEDGIKGLEEERRLAYVAFTRARKRLFLSDSNGFSYIASGNKKTSRFIEEIGIEKVKNAGRSFDPYYQTSSVVDNRVFATSAVNNTKSVDVNYRTNDKVMHDVYKEGLIIKVDGNVLEIAFSYPHGIKKIGKTFKGLRKIK